MEEIFTYNLMNNLGKGIFQGCLISPPPPQPIPTSFHICEANEVFLLLLKYAFQKIKKQSVAQYSLPCARDEAECCAPRYPSPIHCLALPGNVTPVPLSILQSRAVPMG